MLIDKFNRPLELIEIEIFGDSQWHSDFCHPASAVPAAHLFGTEKLLRFLSVMALLGLERIRIAGGEPLLRDDIIPLVKGLTSLHRLKPLELVTNGIELIRQASALGEAGLQKVTILYPARDEALFKEMTGRTRAETDAGIDAARNALLDVRIKMPLVASVNEGEVESIYRWAAERAFSLKIVQARSVSDNKEITACSVEECLCEAGAQRAPEPKNTPTLWNETMSGESIKIATFATRSCMACNRFWIGCDGVITMCDGINSPIDLVEIFDDEPDDSELFNFASKISLNKPKTDRCACTRSPTARI